MGAFSVLFRLRRRQLQHGLLLNLALGQHSLLRAPPRLPL